MSEFTKREESHIGAVLFELMDERRRQHRKWGRQEHPDGTGGEPGKDRTPQEVEELRALRAANALHAKDLCDHVFKNGRGTYRHILREEVEEAMAEDDKAKLRAELIQVAAVAVAWIEKLDREVSR